MKQMGKRALAIILACSFTLTLASCGGKQTENKVSTQSQAAEQLTKVGTYPISEKPLEMSMVRLAMPNVTDFTTNDFSKFIAEKTNIQWKYQTVNLDTSDEQINLMMSKNPLPDAFLFATVKSRINCRI